MEHFSFKEEDTIALGAKLAADLRGGDIITLKGDLGAGKTTLTKAIAKALGVTDDVMSPTFGLMNVYDIPKGKAQKLVHVDTYRLETTQDLIDIGIEDYLGTDNCICIIEWPEKIAELLLHKNVLKIEIQHTDDNSRKIHVI